MAERLSNLTGINQMITCALAAPLLLAAAEANVPRNEGLPSPSLRVEIRNLRNDKGIVRCALFESAAGFPGKLEKAVAGLAVTARGGQARCDFEAVAPGRYAVAVFHDENANGKFDLKLYGVPKEGYGASNNPKPRVGPPRFADAHFEHGERGSNLQIELHYW
jgi:uncharacterized protein (DUF2141 family)